MAKKAYIGVNNVARKVKKGYIGVDGKARKIKKAYIGIGGVARPFWSGGELAYYGAATDFAQSRSEYAAATVGNYALFAGGNTGSANSSKTQVDAYNKSLTRSTPTALAQAKCNHAAASVGSYALFAGGRYYSSSASTTYRVKTVYAYNTSLTRSTATTLSESRYSLSGASVGNYALFAGGLASSSDTTVDAYNKSLTLSAPTALSFDTYNAMATTVGNYALFAGGGTGASTTTVNAYNASLTRSIPTALSGTAIGGHNDLGTTVGNYALFPCLKNSSSKYLAVNAYNASLTRSIPAELTHAHYYGASTTVGEYALITAGEDYNGQGGTVSSKTVDVYDASLTHSTTTSLQSNRIYHCAVTLGDYALIGGGYSSLDSYNDVDVYTIA